MKIKLRVNGTLIPQHISKYITEKMMRNRVKISLVPVIIVFCASAFGAEYKGKNIDGKKYVASVKTEKGIFAASVRFEGKTVFIYLEKEVIEAKLENEIIENENDVPASNEKGSWLISFSPN